MRRRRVSQEGGFTVVELLVTMVVAGILASAIAGVIVAMLRTQGFVATTRDNLDEARIAVERMRQDVRGARRVQSTGPAGAVSDNDQVVIWLDENQDQITDADELIVYQLRTVAGVGQLERYTGISTTPVPLAVGLDLSGTASRFDYDATPVHDSALVTVELTVENPGDERAAPLVVSEQLRLRNAPTN